MKHNTMLEQDIHRVLLAASVKAAQRAYRNNDKVELEAALAQLRRRVADFIKEVEESLYLGRNQMDPETDASAGMRCEIADLYFWLGAEAERVGFTPWQTAWLRYPAGEAWIEKCMA